MKEIENEKTIWNMENQVKKQFGHVDVGHPINKYIFFFLFFIL